MNTGNSSISEPEWKGAIPAAPTCVWPHSFLKQAELGVCCIIVWITLFYGQENSVIP